MSKVFRITPKRIKRTNGQELTPEMTITVTTRSHTTTPFYNGAKEIQEQYMRKFQFDYKKASSKLRIYSQFVSAQRNEYGNWKQKQIDNYVSFD